MRFGRRDSGLIVPEAEVPEKDPLETHADAAAEHYGFTDGERDEFLKMQRRLAGNPALLKKLIKRQQRFARAQRMSSTIKTKRR